MMAEDKMGQQVQEQVPKEIQEQFDIFVVNGMEIINDQKVSEDILNRISQSGDPIRGIAEATVDIVNRLIDSAQENGIKLSNETMVHGSNVLMGEIINMAETAGMQKLTEEQRTQSFQLATSLYLDGAVKSGKMTPEQLAQLSEESKQAQPELTTDIASQENQPPGILNQGGA